MGFDNSIPQISRGSPTLTEVWAKEDAERRAEEIRRIEDARADSKAIWVLAEYSMPPDAMEFFNRHGLGAAGAEIWRQAFAAGWRAAHRRS